VGALILALAACAAGAVLAAPAAGAAPSPADGRYPSDSTIVWETHRLGAGESLESLFGPHWLDVARFNRMDRRHAWPGVRIRVPLRLEEVAGFTPLPAFYAPAESLDRFVLVLLAEQFLGAYERGHLAFGLPVTTGRRGFATPSGDFRITAADPRHASSLYPVEGTNVPYPMPWALLFHRTRGGVGYWIHGRDLPGWPASHGCIGLVDEDMQRRIYGAPADPQVSDARRLYEWVVGPAPGGRWRDVPDGPRVRILERLPAATVPWTAVR
jgi:hypothetical protein